MFAPSSFTPWRRSPFLLKAGFDYCDKREQNHCTAGITSLAPRGANITLFFSAPSAYQMRRLYEPRHIRRRAAGALAVVECSGTQGCKSRNAVRSPLDRMGKRSKSRLRHAFQSMGDWQAFFLNSFDPLSTMTKQTTCFCAGCLFFAVCLVAVVFFVKQILLLRPHGRICVGVMIIAKSPRLTVSRTGNP